MIDFLLGVPGKLSTLLGWFTTYWTAARAAKIDNLDAAVSTRAVASTALTNATWTDARAGKMDAIIQTSVIQSIQTGVIAAGFASSGSYLNAESAYTDVTISSVTPAKCIVLVEGSYWSDPSSPHIHRASGRMISATTVRIGGNAGMDGNSGTYPAVRWYVIEFK